MLVLHSLAIFWFNVVLGSTRVKLCQDLALWFKVAST